MKLVFSEKRVSRGQKSKLEGTSVDKFVTMSQQAYAAIQNIRAGSVATAITRKFYLDNVE